MKKIYFVRHGQSEGNVGPLRQSAETPLTEKGREQAAYIAKRAKNLPIEAIVASPMTRARDTAEVISGEIGLSIEFSDLFVERRRPSVSLGKPKDDPEMVALEEAIRNNFHAAPYTRLSDEENFEDLKERARQALDFLASREEEHILVVTHGFFLRVVLALVTLGESLTGEECGKFVRTFETENTGVSVFLYDENRPNRWRLWVWNDHAHLG